MGVLEVHMTSVSRKIDGYVVCNKPRWQEHCNEGVRAPLPVTVI
jgi:hypothetical protein